MNAFRIPLLALAATLSVPALVRPAAAQPGQYPVSITNNTGSPVEMSWSRNGGPFQPLGMMSAGGGGGVNVTPGDTIRLRNAETGQVYKMWVPRGAETVSLGGNARPQPQPQPFRPQPEPFRPQPQPQPFRPRPQPQPQPAARYDVEAEKAAAINYLNAVRQNPMAYRQDLGADVAAAIAKTSALRTDPRLTAAAQRKAEYLARGGATGSTPHIMVINGRQVGMNKWMRDAGYNVPAMCKDNETNFECLSMSGSGGGFAAGEAVEAMKRLLKHEPHRIPMTGGNQFWKPCTDIGVGIAVSPDGRTMWMSVVFCYEK